MIRVKRGRQISFDTSSWKIPYGTMMLLCMIFFLILYSFAYTSGINYEKVIANLQAGVSGETKSLKEIEAAQKISDIFGKDKMASGAVKVDAKKIRISLPSPVLFDSGSSQIKRESFSALNKIAQALKEMDNKVIVEGHTDDVPFKKLPGGNFELSTLRAFEVIKYFIDIAKIPPGRFSAYGFGPYKPVASNETDEGRQKNRRIEISILRE
ncbi:MAG: flagellar motor protein MotB [Elusimicrobia bacterium]|nr:flagellar motor protein MotB [Elusimicrobiota bacterium]